MKILVDIGIQIPTVYLPKPGVDLKKWAVIACDQFTLGAGILASGREIVGEAPSTLNLSFPKSILKNPPHGTHSKYPNRRCANIGCRHASAA